MEKLNTSVLFKTFLGDIGLHWKYKKYIMIVVKFIGVGSTDFSEWPLYNAAIITWSILVRAVLANERNVIYIEP